MEVVKIADMYGKYVVFVPFKHYTSNCDIIVLGVGGLGFFSVICFVRK